MSPDKQKLRLKIIKQLCKLSRDLQQVIDDKEYWNDNRPEEMPFDVGWDKAMLFYTDRQLEAFLANDHEAFRLWQLKIDRMARDAEGSGF